MIKTFKTCAAQGDLLIRKIDALPSGVTELPAEAGLHILAHSETGHHHAVLDRPDVKHYAAMDKLRSFLVVTDDPVDLEHHRHHDTHEPIRIAPGIYELRRQREHTPEGFRRVQD